MVFSIIVSGKEEVVILQELDQNTESVFQEKIIQTIRNSINKKFGIDIYAVLLVQSESLPKTISGKPQSPSESV